MKHTILLTGASGYVGARVYQDLKKARYNVTGIYHSNKLFDDLIKADITNAQEIQDLIYKLKPSVIIHCAADAHSSTCENDPENAKRLNVEATSYIAVAAKKIKAKVVYISTFGCYTPQNVLHHTKLEAEKIVEKLPNHVIIRASLVVGLSPNTNGGNYYNDLLLNVKNKQPIEADTSWEFEMTYLGHLSEIIQTAIDRDGLKNTLLPVIAFGATSRYQLAKDLLKGSGIKVTPIDQKRTVPIQNINNAIYKNLNLPTYTYAECLYKMRAEIKIRQHRT